MTASPSARSPLTILLAEDDQDFRSLLATVLRREGHEVIELEDSARLHDEILRRSSQPGRRTLLIVTDVRMPGGDSLSVLRTFKDAGTLPPFILMTAYADDRTRAAARDLGALLLFAKPFDFDDLRAAMADVTRVPAAGD